MPDLGEVEIDDDTLLEVSGDISEQKINAPTATEAAVADTPIDKGDFRLGDVVAVLGESSDKEYFVATVVRKEDNLLLHGMGTAHDDVACLGKEKG